MILVKTHYSLTSKRYIPKNRDKIISPFIGIDSNTYLFYFYSKENAVIFKISQDKDN